METYKPIFDKNTARVFFLRNKKSLSEFHSGQRQSKKIM
jgi:hypothetical protein